MNTDLGEDGFEFLDSDFAKAGEVAKSSPCSSSDSFAPRKTTRGEADTGAGFDVGFLDLKWMEKPGLLMTGRIGLFVEAMQWKRSSLDRRRARRRSALS